MLKYFVEKACQKYVFAKPRVVVGVPLRSNWGRRKCGWRGCYRSWS
jgi:actin-like ATPase involved in cell morphogenesis